MKRTIKLKETELKHMIAESVKRVLREERGNRHPSQNDLPSIDKFHPDWWYYREEMDEPDDIDINYENESKNMNKKITRLTESDLHRIVRETVNKILKEAKTIRKVEYSKMPYDKKTQQDIDWRNYQNRVNQSAEYVDDGDDYIGGYYQYELDDDDINSNIDYGLDDMQRSLGKFNSFDRPSKGEKSMKILGYLDGDRKHRDALTQPFLGDDGAYNLHQKRLYNKNMAKRNTDADRRWKKAADTRPLYRKNSPNNDIPR